MTQLICEPTRVTTTTRSLLDIILTNVPNLHTGTGVFKTTLSDHYLIWTEFNVRLSTKKYNHKEVIVEIMKTLMMTSF